MSITGRAKLGDWRVSVEEDWGRDGVAVRVFRNAGEHGSFAIGQDGQETHVPPHVAPPLDIQPTLRIAPEAGRALLDALLQHFGGVVEAQTLRSDYLHERTRVDVLTEAIVKIAHRVG